MPGIGHPISQAYTIFWIGHSSLYVHPCILTFPHLVVLSLQIVLNRQFHSRLIHPVLKIQVTSTTGGVWISNGIASLMPMICVSQDVFREHSDYTKNLLLLLFLSLNSTAVPGRTHVILAHS